MFTVFLKPRTFGVLVRSTSDRMTDAGASFLLFCLTQLIFQALITVQVNEQ